MRVLLPLLLLLSACAPALPAVNDADRAWARQAFPETADELDESRGLYATKCSGCHMLVLPQNVPHSEWPMVIAKMAPKAKLDDAQRGRILRYVLTASRPGQAPLQ
jgi:mono/diheme cytochrome c family protein